MTVRVEPQTIEFGAITPGVTGGKMAYVNDCPAAAAVTAGFVDGSPYLSVARLVVSYWHTQPVDPSELPPVHIHGPKPRRPVPPPTERILFEAAESNGTTTVMTAAGAILSVYCAATIPHDASGGEVYGDISIVGDGVEIARIPAHAFIGGVTLTVDSPLSLRQGETVVVAMTATSVAGPDTSVSVELHSGPESEGLAMQSPRTPLPSTESRAFTATISASADCSVGSHDCWVIFGAFGGMQGAYDSRGRFLGVPVTITVTAATLHVACATVERITVIVGSSTSVPVDVWIGGGNGQVDVEFTGASLPAGITMLPSPQWINVVNNKDWFPGNPMNNVDANGMVQGRINLQVAGDFLQGALQRDVDVSLDWNGYSGAQTGSCDVQLAVLSPSAKFSGEIASGGLAALGGAAEVTIFYDGTTQWGGHAHDSGADGYAFGVNAMLSSHNGRVVAFVHHGHVGGTLTSGSRDHDWDDHYPVNDVIAKHYRDFQKGVLQLSTEYSSDIGSTLESALSVITSWVLGSTPLGAAIGLVIFVGVEVGSLISTGSLVPGARVVEGVLWLAGPSNTLLALAAEGIASVGSRSRELSAEEYAWANSEVFSGTLPEKSRIVLTDTIGAGSRAFTFPRFDGKITVNMGPDSFDNPRAFQMSRGRVFGEVFIHELVHAWQIAHTPMELTLIADALASKICEASGGDPYTYGAAGPPYSDFNLEQQAQIISDWFSGRTGPKAAASSSAAKDPNSPYFGHVQQNIRRGQY